MNLPINFGNQIVPIFTKLGCNSGGCHGKASGQNGFKTSLLGFEPEVDYNALVKEARGRRVFPAAPDNSLLLIKASGGIAHGGGKRMEVGSDEYRLIRRWIAAGTPFGEPTDPKVTKITVYSRPPHHDAQQQAAVRRLRPLQRRAVEDITRRAQYESNDQEIAAVDAAGLVRTLAMSGEAAVMVRYQEYVSTSARRSRSACNARPTTSSRRRSWISTRPTSGSNSALCPSELCSDEQFIRRLSLDLTGTLPTPRR